MIDRDVAGCRFDWTEKNPPPSTPSPSESLAAWSTGGSASPRGGRSDGTKTFREVDITGRNVARGLSDLDGVSRQVDVKERNQDPPLNLVFSVKYGKLAGAWTELAFGRPGAPGTSFTPSGMSGASSGTPSGTPGAPGTAS